MKTLKHQFKNLVIGILVITLMLSTGFFFTRTVSADTPIIYVNQKLIIPGTITTPASTSKVVSSGIITKSYKRIALTFDAGWLYDQTIPLLNVLDKYGVKATFFLRAKWAKDHPTLAWEIRKRGHVIENHSLTHSHMKTMTSTQILYEITEATKILKSVTKSNPYLFRPPYGEYNTKMLTLLGSKGYIYTIMWTVDSHDWAKTLNGVTITTSYLINRVLTKATDRGIVLMHVGGYHTVEALPKIITGLKNKGYTLVTVNSMLYKPKGYVYTVIKGDTLWSIARRYGVTVDSIIKANNL